MAKRLTATTYLHRQIVLPTALRGEVNVFHFKVDQHLPQLRDAGTNDLERVSAWISEGRAQGAFHPNSILLPAALRAYIAKQRILHDEYRLIVVECLEKPCGFIDFHRDGDQITILGIYIVPALRRKRIGHHVLALLSAEWMYGQRARVSVDVFSKNVPSLALFTAEGFSQSVPRQQQDLDLLTLHKSLVRPPRIAPISSAYSQLRGNNVVAQHFTFAQELAATLITHDGVEMVLGLGGIARGFADEWSDVDIAVLGSNVSSKELWRGEKWFGSFDVDLFIIDLNHEPPETWDPSRRQALSEAIVLAGNSPTLLRKIRDVVHMSKGEMRSRAVSTLLALGWMGYSPPAWFGKVHRGYLWSLPSDLWVQRGSFDSAYSTLDQAVNLLIELIFITNQTLPPDPKWMRYLLGSQPWQPRDLSARLKSVTVGARNRKSFPVRSALLSELVSEVANQLEDRGLLPRDMYKFYLRHSDVY